MDLKMILLKSFNLRPLLIRVTVPKEDPSKVIQPEALAPQSHEPQEDLTKVVQHQALAPQVREPNEDHANVVQP